MGRNKEAATALSLLTWAFICEHNAGLSTAAKPRRDLTEEVCSAQQWRSHVLNQTDRAQRERPQLTTGFTREEREIVHKLEELLLCESGESFGSLQLRERKVCSVNFFALHNACVHTMVNSLRRYWV